MTTLEFFLHKDYRYGVSVLVRPGIVLINKNHLMFPGGQVSRLFLISGCFSIFMIKFRSVCVVIETSRVLSFMFFFNYVLSRKVPEVDGIVDVVICVDFDRLYFCLLIFLFDSSSPVWSVIY